MQGPWTSSAWSRRCQPTKLCCNWVEMSWMCWKRVALGHTTLVRSLASKSRRDRGRDELDVPHARHLGPHDSLHDVSLPCLPRHRRDFDVPHAQRSRSHDSLQGSAWVSRHAVLDDFSLLWVLRMVMEFSIARPTAGTYYETMINQTRLCAVLEHLPWPQRWACGACLYLQQRSG